MKYRDYMEVHCDENLDWCKPYVSDKSDEYCLIMYDGEPDAVIMPDGTFYRYNGSLTDEVMEAFARAVNSDYDLHSGYDDWLIALRAMHEVGCASCPFSDDCEAMDEQYGEDE